MLPNSDMEYTLLTPCTASVDHSASKAPELSVYLILFVKLPAAKRVLPSTASFVMPPPFMLASLFIETTVTVPYPLRVARYRPSP